MPIIIGTVHWIDILKVIYSKGWSRRLRQQRPVADAIQWGRWRTIQAPLLNRAPRPSSRRRIGSSTCSGPTEAHWWLSYCRHLLRLPSSDNKNRIIWSSFPQESFSSLLLFNALHRVDCKYCNKKQSSRSVTLSSYTHRRRRFGLSGRD